ncbi:5-deoxy-glucuronate isomerase [Jiangella endophytica]|uniref:5-deoxy-glucuronate isomerase n=1 Tax=Jiangella endophytica TaxID=1623398 RepID=UPI000E3419C6|nr:5-deoxy-glucuronate isomerase [Jiangella endophytica]
MSSAYFERLEARPGVTTLAHNTCRVLDFTLITLRPGEQHHFATTDREYAVVVLTGTASLEVGDRTFADVGGRSDVFAGKPSMVYAPCGQDVTITTAVGTELALCSAPSATVIEPYVVAPDDVHSGTWGVFNTTRDYDFLLDASRPSERLFVAEVTVASGNWATYPPHRHEVDDPETGEVFQEEMYFYRVQPSTGFGLAALYGDRVGGDNAFIVRHNTIHKMPAGYHTVTAAPGYRVWYLALFAGDRKQAGPLTDADHAWYHQAETTIGHLRRTIGR